MIHATLALFLFVLVMTPEEKKAVCEKAGETAASYAEARDVGASIHDTLAIERKFLRHYKDYDGEEKDYVVQLVRHIVREVYAKPYVLRYQLEEKIRSNCNRGLYDRK
jgi:hypothetical protein